MVAAFRSLHPLPPNGNISCYRNPFQKSLAGKNSITLPSPFFFSLRSKGMRGLNKSPEMDLLFFREQVLMVISVSRSVVFWELQTHALAPSEPLWEDSGGEVTKKDIFSLLRSHFWAVDKEGLTAADAQSPLIWKPDVGLEKKRWGWEEENECLCVSEGDKHINKTILLCSFLKHEV